MLKIAADDKIPFLRGVLEPFAQVKYLPGGRIDKASVENADALIIRTRTKCTPELLAGTGIKFIGTATIGFDHIDTRYCDSRGIKWINAPGCNSSSVQQYMAAALLRISQEFRFKLADKVIGIVGAGNVGSKVEKLAKLLGMKVLVNDPPRARREGERGFTDFETVLNEADIITMHVPLTFVGADKTYHMINSRVIKKMKKGVWFINTSRGDVADSASLKKSAKAGRFAGIVCDVWEHEPDIDHELMDISYISTPHIAGYSTDGKANGTSMVINELARFFDLPLKDWYPSAIPGPEKPIININGKNKETETIIREAVNHTYNITEDDLKLRFSPSEFDKIRGEYPSRREFPAYTVNLVNSKKSTSRILAGMGFKCV